MQQVLQVKFNDLTFGVELEFSGITRLQATEVLVEFFGSAFVKYGGWDNDEYHVPDQQGRIWQIVKDNSIDAQRIEGNTGVPATEDTNVNWSLGSCIMRNSYLPRGSRHLKE
jgi:hypothetical protein